MTEEEIIQLAITNGEQSAQGYNATIHDAIIRNGRMVGYKAKQSEEVAQANTDKKITRLAFLDRFTDDEAIDLDLAGIDDPTADASTRRQQARIRRFWTKVNAAEYIDLDREETKTGVNALATFSLITTTRANEILNDPIQDVERPRNVTS